jgi:aldehyde dehydrogenase (NAD+)
MSTTTVETRHLLINNEWRPSSSGRTMDVVNPATEEVVAAVAAAEPADVEAAVQAARAALAGPWGAMSARERGRLVRRLADRLLERVDEVARLETVHNGKPISESRHIEIPAAAECFEYYAGWADKVMGETIPVKGNHLTYTLREPLGVVEGRARTGLRQHGDSQASEPDAPDGHCPRGDRGRGGPATGCAQRDHRCRIHGRPGHRRTSGH